MIPLFMDAVWLAEVATDRFTEYCMQAFSIEADKLANTKMDEDEVATENRILFITYASS